VTDAQQTEQKSAQTDNKTEGAPMEIEADNKEGSSDATPKAQPKSKEQNNEPRLFFGNTTFYIFFRLYQILYDRLNKAREMAKHCQLNEESDRPTVQILLGKRPVRFTYNISLNLTIWYSRSKVTKRRRINIKSF